MTDRHPIPMEDDDPMTPADEERHDDAQRQDEHHGESYHDAVAEGDRIARMAHDAIEGRFQPTDELPAPTGAPEPTAAQLRDPDDHALSSS